MKKLNLQMLHLGSALALLVGFLFSAAVNAQTTKSFYDDPSGFHCNSLYKRQPACTTRSLTVPKYDLLYYGFLTKGPFGVSPVETEFKIYNNVGMLVITRRLLPNQALNGQMRVTNDNRYYRASAKLLSEHMYLSSVAASISRYPTNYTAPTLRDPSAGGFFY